VSRFPSLPLADARRELLARAPALDTAERLAVEDALGRVTAGSVVARNSVPHYCGAAMDGIAVRAGDTAGATEGEPVTLERGDPGSVARPFSYVDTGNALPAWADAVVMIERVFAGAADAGSVPTAAPVRSSAARELPATVHLRSPAPAWQHVRMIGEDVVASEPIVPRGHRLRPFDIGALLAAGVTEVEVRPRPRVAILPTGDELIEPGEELAPGRIVEFNSRMIAAFVREWGGEPVRLAPAGDDLASLAVRVEKARDDSDVVCLIAGSSAGRRDFTADALASVGRILAHGVDVVPGRPAILAALDAAPRSRARVALGIPGYPVSAIVICLELLAPLVAHLLGARHEERPKLRALVPHELPSKRGNEELIRVHVGRVGDRVVAMPLGRGAGAISTVSRADGFVRVPATAERVAAGEEVEVELLRPVGEALGTILVSGCQDPSIALLADVLRASHPEYKLATSWARSGDGLRALGAGEAHIAAVGRAPEGPVEADALAILPSDLRVRVVHVAAREQGLIVPPGNPLGLRALADLAGRRVHFAAGSPTAGVPETREPGAGAAREVLVHSAAAEAVRSGLADAGLGVAAAAAALGLDFVPIEREDYDLVLREDFAASAVGEAFLAALRSEAFRASLAALPGYDARRTGQEKSLSAASG
jgi:putative molybdopterin biosynthesis protein